MSLTSIQEEIAHLSSTERAMLIDILWESLDEARVKEIEAKWAAESEERIDRRRPRQIANNRWAFRPSRPPLLDPEMTQYRFTSAALTELRRDPARWQDLL
jgi:hypothetical protein